MQEKQDALFEISTAKRSLSIPLNNKYMILDIQSRPVKFKVVTRIRKISRKLSLPCKRCKQLQSLKVLFSSSRSEVMNIFSVIINYYRFSGLFNLSFLQVDVSKPIQSILNEFSTVYASLNFITYQSFFC